MKEAYTTTATMLLDEDGILHVKLRDGAQIGLSDVQNHYRVTQRLLEGKKGLVLVDARVKYSFSAEARTYVASQSAESRLATAVLVSSRAGKHLANLYLRINRPVSPTRLFTKEKEAVRWLLSFKASS